MARMKIFTWAGAHFFVSERLKNALVTRVSEKDEVEFFPINVHSNEYGDRTYYLIHFKKKHNVINPEISKTSPGDSTITVLGLDKKKSRGAQSLQFRYLCTLPLHKRIISQRVKGFRLDFRHGL